MVTEQDLKIFINAASGFFTQLTTTAAIVDTPFLKESNDAVIHEFSATLDVSGSKHGRVYYSATRKMLQDLVASMGEPDIDNDAILADYVGEMVNTISGNARSELGSRFMISVPTIFPPTKAADVQFPAGVSAFVIPLIWRNHKSTLIICLDAFESDVADIDLNALEDSVLPEDIG